MAYADDFEKAWRARFSTQAPPDLDLDRMDSPSINKALLECKAKITEYQRKLHQQEFIHGYLWDIANKKKPSGAPDRSSNVHFTASNPDYDNFMGSMGSGCMERRGEAATPTVAYTIKKAIPQNAPVPQPVEQVPYEPKPTTTKQPYSDSFRARQQFLENSIKSNKTLEEHDREKIVGASKSSDDLSQPDRSRNYVNLDYSDVHVDTKPLERTGSDGSLSRSGKKYSKPVPAPRPSILGPTVKDQAGAIAGEFQERLSIKRAQSPSNMDRGDNTKEEKIGNKFNLRRNHGNHQYESIHLPEAGPAPALNLNLNNQQPQQPNVPPPVMSSFKPRTSSTESSDSVVSGISSFKPLPTAKELENPYTPPPQVPPPLYKRSDSTVSSVSTFSTPSDVSNGVRPKPPKIGARTESLDSNVSPDSPKLPQKNIRRQKEHIYDEPVPVGGQAQEDSDSSSDEEPIYFNILLLKQKTMQKTQTMYSSVDNQKQRVENQAHRLSRKFNTQSLDLSGKMRPIPPKVAAPVMRPIREKAVITGVTTTESITESTTSPAIEEQRCDSVDSLGSQGSAGSEDSGARDLDAIWRKRQSMKIATVGTGDTDSTSTDDLDMEVPIYQETDKVQMRKWVVNSILESEKIYVSVLDVLQQYQKSFKAVAHTEHEVVPEEELDVIFFKIADLHRVHNNFIRDLQPVVDNWTPESCIAPQFKILAVEELPIASDYLKNYQRAVTTIARLAEREENAQFFELSQNIKVVGMKETQHLQELLHKPVVRIQRNTLVLHDLIRCTPAAHPDYDLLQKTLKLAHEFLENFQSPQTKDSPENQRYLAKFSPIVELNRNKRKLRHVFLFNDIIICAKQKISGKKITYDVKWAISLFDLLLDEKVCAQEEKKLAEYRREEIEDLQRKVSELQGEMKRELKKLRQDGQRKGSIRSRNKTIEKIRKKLMTQETQLVLASPHLVFRLTNKKKKEHFTLLMASDYERNNWKETVHGLKTKVNKATDWRSVDVTDLINTVKLPKMNLGLLDNEELYTDLEEEHLFGSLHVTIHRLIGMNVVADTYCRLELDSFSHFFMKAKTHIISNTRDPVWNDDFEIELEGAQTLRILVYKIGADSDPLIGKCALELSKAWLRGDFQEKSISINEEMSVTVSLKYITRDQTLRRRPSNVKGGMFGVPLAQLAKREGCKIPAVVETCVRELEKRGLDDLGLYRISGLSSEIQRMKKAFDKNPRGAAEVARETDVNALAGLLKLYFRELPEALFTDALYPQLVDSMGLSDPDAKERCMIAIRNSLPEPNKTVVNYVIAHIVKVAQHEAKNKMDLQNLATVFGPTLLRPATKENEPISIDNFSAHAHDAMTQTHILLHYLQLEANADTNSTQL